MYEIRIYIYSNRTLWPVEHSHTRTDLAPILPQMQQIFHPMFYERFVQRKRDFSCAHIRHFYMELTSPDKLNFIRMNDDKNQTTDSISSCVRQRRECRSGSGSGSTQTLSKHFNSSMGYTTLLHLEQFLFISLVGNIFTIFFLKYASNALALIGNIFQLWNGWIVWPNHTTRMEFLLHQYTPRTLPRYM